METYRLAKKDLVKFLSAISKKFSLAAPVKEDLVRFEYIKDPAKICLDEKPFFPIKEHFFSQKEVLFRYEGNKLEVIEQKSKKTVFFGIRRCDLNSIMRQDMVFLKDISDPYYAAARQNVFLLGYHCEKVMDEFCFCGSMGLTDFFDLMFYDRKDNLLVEVGSERGSFLISEFKRFFERVDLEIPKEQKVIAGADRLEKKEIGKYYDNPDWKKGFEICLSCTACTTLCPSCYCFEIHDEPCLSDPKKGERCRQWSSCMVQEFTRVAHDHVYRKGRVERFKHRIYHQLDYFKQKHGINLCTGCGRCISGCPTRIDFVKILNEMK